jgi:hypothetical protein
MYAAPAKLCRIDSVAIRGDFRIRLRRFFHPDARKLSLSCQKTALLPASDRTRLPKWRAKIVSAATSICRSVSLITKRSSRRDQSLPDYRPVPVGPRSAILVRSRILSGLCHLSPWTTVASYPDVSFTCLDVVESKYLFFPPRRERRDSLDPRNHLPFP